MLKSFHTWWKRREREDNAHKRLLAVLGEHGDEDIEANIEFRLVGRGHVDKDVGRVEGDLCVVTVDDGRHREDGTRRVVEDGIDGGGAEDGKVLSKVKVRLWQRCQLPVGDRMGQNGTS
jgi:hypothetical protein